MTFLATNNEPNKELSILRDLLSFEEERIKNNKRHPCEERLSGKEASPCPDNVKDELKEESVVIDMDIDQVGSMKNDPEVPAEPPPNNLQFQSYLEKNYTSKFDKDHIEDVKILFNENTLGFEKRKFYQQIFNNILEKTNQRKIEDLQKEYLKHLHQVSEVETFKCSSCDYQTINKTNLKSHLFLIHKNELEYQVFRCLSCKYKSKSITYLKKHLTVHEDSASNDNYSDFDVPISSPQISKKRKVKTKKNPSKQCDLCEFKTDLKQAFETHKNSHVQITEKGKIYKCYVCDHENRNKIGLKKHLLKEHDLKTLGLDNRILKCDTCDYTTLDKESLRVHSLSHKNPDEIEWFSCQECEFKTKFKRNLTNHVMLHNPDQIVKKYLCEVCSRSFRTRGKLTLHSLTHKTIDQVSEIFQCEQCEYKTKNKYHLKQHMEVHKVDSERFVCDTCGFQSKRKWNYDAHVLTHKDDTEVKLHSCDVCGYTTKFKDRLTRHLKKGTHLAGKNGSKPTTYSCSGCNFETLNRKSYYDHIQSHDNPEELAKSRFACEICGFRTKNKGGLAQHSLSHKRTEEVRSFKCPQAGCEFQSKFRGSLAAHLDRHKDPSQVTIYKCDICGLQSRSKWNHNMHLVTHKSSNEVEVFNCTICSYQTKFKAYLKAHLKKRHGIVTTRVRVKDVVV